MSVLSNTLLGQQVAFITGGASGIGAATARRFAGEGASIVLADVQDDQGRQLCEELQAQGARALYVHCDVSDADSVEKAVQASLEHFGRLHIVFANAGINGVWAPIEVRFPRRRSSPVALQIYLSPPGSGGRTPWVNGCRVSCAAVPRCNPDAKLPGPSGLGARSETSGGSGTRPGPAH